MAAGLGRQPGDMPAAIGEIGALRQQRANAVEPVEHVPPPRSPRQPLRRFIVGHDCQCLGMHVELGPFSGEPDGEILSIDTIAKINKRLPNTHMVMHGSSSVPQDLLAIINQYGGKMKETYGVPVEEIQEAIKHGVRKINIDTDIRMAMTGAVRKFMSENPDKFDMREWMKPAREAAKAVCKQRYMEFGCEGQGAKIKGMSLSVMAQKYAAGELAQQVN